MTKKANTFSGLPSRGATTMIVKVVAAALLGVLGLFQVSAARSAAADETSAPPDIEQIRAVITLYAKALDRRDYESLRRVFTADATGNYHEAGSYKGVDALMDLMQRALSQCAGTQHLLGSMDVEVHGDVATASTYLQAIHVGKNPGFEGKLLTIWGEYRDELVRTPQGWRISSRELKTIHAEGDIGMKL